MTTVTATEIQNNFGKYLQYVISGEEVIILKNGKEVARLISKDKAVTFLTDSLVGILSNDYEDKQMRKEICERRMNRYENLD